MSSARHLACIASVVLVTVIVGCGPGSDSRVADKADSAPETSPEAPKLAPAPLAPRAPEVPEPSAVDDVPSADDNSQQPAEPDPSEPTPSTPPEPAEAEPTGLAALDGVAALFVSADGTKLVVSRYKRQGEKPLELWDLSTGKKLSAFGGDGYGTRALSPDGRFLARSDLTSRQKDEKIETVLHIDSGKTREVRIKASRVDEAEFSYDGKKVVYSCLIDRITRKLVVFELATQKVKTMDFLDGRYMTQIRCSPVEDTVALSRVGRDTDGETKILVELYDLGSLRLKKRMTPQKGSGVPVFSGDGGTMAALGGELHMLVWDTATWQMRELLAVEDKYADEAPTGYGHLSVSRDGTMLAALPSYSFASRPKTHAWDVQSGARREMGPWAIAAQFLPNGLLVITPVEKGQGVRFYDPTTGEERFPPFAKGDAGDG